VSNLLTLVRRFTPEARSENVCYGKAVDACFLEEESGFGEPGYKAIENHHKEKITREKKISFLLDMFLRSYILLFLFQRLYMIQR